MSQNIYIVGWRYCSSFSFLEVTQDAWWASQSILEGAKKTIFPRACYEIFQDMAVLLIFLRFKRASGNFSASRRFSLPRFCETELPLFYSVFLASPWYKTGSIAKISISRGGTTLAIE